MALFLFAENIVHNRMVLLALALVIGFVTVAMIRSLMQRRFEWT